MGHPLVIAALVWIGGGIILGTFLYLKTWRQEREKDIWKDSRHRKDLRRDVMLAGIIWPFMFMMAIFLAVVTAGLPLDAMKRMESEEKER